MGRDFRKLQGPYSTVWDKLHLGTWPRLCVCLYVCCWWGVRVDRVSGELLLPPPWYF